MSAVRKKKRKKKKDPSANIIRFLGLALLILVLAIIGVLAAGKIQKQTDLTLYPLRYETEIRAAGTEFDVPLSVICGVIHTESGFDPEAVSSAGARGLMQLMPATLEWIAWRLNEPADQTRVFDPAFNIRYGTYLLSFLYERFGDWETVYAGYNAGHTRVEEWLKDPSLSQNGKLIRIPFPETEGYVRKAAKAADEYERLYFSDNKGETENGRN